jgi:hypothetical protein
MAFTGTEERKIFEILEIPHTTSIVRFSRDGFGVDAGTILITTAISAYNTIAAGLSADDETAVRAHITEYDGVRYSVAKISSGGVEGASGLEYDPEDARRRIRRLVQRIIPIFRKDEEVSDAYGLHGASGELQRG